MNRSEIFARTMEGAGQIWRFVTEDGGRINRWRYLIMFHMLESLNRRLGGDMQ